MADLIGQEEISKTLLSQLSSGKVGQGYLFWGPKGTGKTSTARILAKAVNCEVYKSEANPKFGEPCNKCANCVAIADGSFLDLVEIDAASNRGIDEIRDLREKVKLAPAMGRYKVYIIDEAHMLTNEAFNALLKTLEEPPKHVIFILATTEYSKLPPTIVSRLQKFNFKRASVQGLVEAILKVAKHEGIKVKIEAARAIADSSDGSFRDAVSILDQVSAEKGEVKESDVFALVQSTGVDKVVRFLELLAGFSLKEAVLFVDELPKMGIDTSLFVRQTVFFLEKVLYLKIGVSADELDVDEADYLKIKKLENGFTMASLQKLIRLLVVAEGEMKNYPFVSVPVVLALCRWCEEDEPIDNRASNRREADLSEVSTKGEASKNFKQSGPLEAQKQPNVQTSAGARVKKEIKAGVSIMEVEKNWSEFLNRVRGANAHVFALLRATKPRDIEGESLSLEVFYRFHKDKLEEPKIIKMLDTTMGEVLGKDIRLRFVLAARESQPTKTVAKSDVVDTRASELEQIAQEIFSK